VPGAHQTVSLEFGIGGADRVDVYAELGRKVAQGRKSLSGIKLAVGDKERDAGANLGRDS
jgi:hypothetical protein